MTGRLQDRQRVWRFSLVSKYTMEDKPLDACLLYFSLRLHTKPLVKQSGRRIPHLSSLYHSTFEFHVSKDGSPILSSRFRHSSIPGRFERRLSRWQLIHIAPRSRRWRTGRISRWYDLPIQPRHSTVSIIACHCLEGRWRVRSNLRRVNSHFLHNDELIGCLRRFQEPCCCTTGIEKGVGSGGCAVREAVHGDDVDLCAGCGDGAEVAAVLTGS